MPSDLEYAYGLVQQVGSVRYLYLGVYIQKLPITELYYLVKPGTEGVNEEYFCAEADLVSAMDRIETTKW